MKEQHETEEFKSFIKRLKLLVNKRSDLITMTLSNIFTMRLIGNKTHGDLAEIAISEFVNQYMYDFQSLHIGKDMFRAKSREEDIKIINEVSKGEFPVSLKAYGLGPLQLSTNKSFTMFPRLEKEKDLVTDKDTIKQIFSDSAFKEFEYINVLPLIYDEKNKCCNILVFDYLKAKKNTTRIQREDNTGNRKHPVYRFFDKNDSYICEVRYGGTSANALQRGLWSHTQNALNYFDSITKGWIDYSDNKMLIKLFSHSLVASETGHKSALKQVDADISRLIKKGNTKK